MAKKVFQARLYLADMPFTPKPPVITQDALEISFKTNNIFQQMETMNEYPINMGQDINQTKDDAPKLQIDFDRDNNTVPEAASTKQEPTKSVISLRKETIKRKIKARSNATLPVKKRLVKPELVKSDLVTITERSTLPKRKRVKTVPWSPSTASTRAAIPRSSLTPRTLLVPASPQTMAIATEPTETAATPIVPLPSHPIKVSSSPSEGSTLTPMTPATTPVQSSSTTSSFSSSAESSQSKFKTIVSVVPIGKTSNSSNNLLKKYNIEQIPVEYHPNMARKYPTNVIRTPKEQQIRNKNTLSARQSRAKTKLVLGLLEVESETVRLETVNHYRALSSFAVYANSLRKALDQPEIDWILWWDKFKYHAVCEIEKQVAAKEKAAAENADADINADLKTEEQKN